MALATRCPYCNTTFRVTHDQLKLRGGLVRCGACKEIFNGVEHLLAAQEPAAAPASPTTPIPASTPAFTPAPTVAATAGPAAHRAPDAVASFPPEPGIASAPQTPDTTPASDHPTQAPGADAEQAPETPVDFEAGIAPAEEVFDPAAPSPEPSAPAQPESASPSHLPAGSGLPPTTPEQDIDPLTRMTLMDMRPWPQEDSLLPGATAESAGTPRDARDESDEIDRALGELQQKPWRGSEDQAGVQNEPDEFDALDNEVPEFVRQARLQARRQRRTRLLLAVASMALLLLALLQAAILMRTEIAARWPATRPALAGLCNVAGCAIGLPQQIEYVTIESHELQALPNSENGFVLSTLLRNRSKVVQAWPYLELTLNDAAEQPVARRVLAPADYLSAQERARGMPPSSERPVRVAFTLAQLKASGYRLYVFYP